MGLGVQEGLPMVYKFFDVSSQSISVIEYGFRLALGPLFEVVYVRGVTNQFIYPVIYRSERVMATAGGAFKLVIIDTE